MTKPLLLGIIVLVLLGGITVYVFSMPEIFVGPDIPPRGGGQTQAKAYFAGGCFWCTEADFQKVEGVSEVISGYAGGKQAKPTYEEVSSHQTGHRESIEVRYDPNVVSYRQLVEYFFDHIDPTDATGQFNDRGESYTTAIFYQNESEERDVKAVIAWLTENHVYQQPIATAVTPWQNFYPAEDFHQNYSERNPVRYGYYRSASGRDELTQQVCRIKTEKRLPCFTGKLKP